MTRTRTPRILSVVLALAAVLTMSAAPAAAQYGGVGGLTVDPVEVEIDGAFGYFGLNCPAATTLEITIDGFPQILDTTISDSSGNFLGTGVEMPSGVVAGQNYIVTSDCDGSVSTFMITAVCNDGTFPVDGACPDGQTVGGIDPAGGTTTTTTTTTPGGTTTTPGSTTPGSGGSGGLAITGASNAQIAVQFGVTLMAFGGLLLLATNKRRDQATV